MRLGVAQVISLVCLCSLVAFVGCRRDRDSAEPSAAPGIAAADTDRSPVARTGAADEPALKPGEPDELTHIAPPPLGNGAPSIAPEGPDATPVTSPRDQAPTDDRVQTLIAQLTDVDADVRVKAMQELVEVGAPAVGPLIRRLESEDAETRLTAVTALGALHDDAAKAVPALVKCLRDKESGVRCNAAGVLGLFGEDAKQAIGPLVDCLDDEAPIVRANAASALGQIGGGAPEVLEAVEGLLSDDHPGVREAATEAVGKLRGGAR